MNCKKGDMALIVKGVQSGTVVTCLEYIGSAPHPIKGRSFEDEDMWRIDRTIVFRADRGKGRFVGNFHLCPDHILMPIQPPPKMRDEETRKPIEEET